MFGAVLDYDLALTAGTVAGNLATTGAMADEHDVTETKMFNQLGKVVGPVIDVVSLPRLL